MIHGAWRTGEPGVFFIDEANRYNPVPHLGAYEATNPCGEQPLLPYDVCNLGSINVGAFVKDGQIDWDALRRDIHLSTHFLDNVIDANKYPLPEIDRSGAAHPPHRPRRDGLRRRCSCSSASPTTRRRASSSAGRSWSSWTRKAKRERERLAEERGVVPRVGAEHLGPGRDLRARRRAASASGRCSRLRNCNVTTVAPTGTISIIAGCCSGIEPLFAVAFMRNQAGVLMPDVNEDFVAIAQAGGLVLATS